jgi:hypothetical protein
MDLVPLTVPFRNGLSGLDQEIQKYLRKRRTVSLQRRNITETLDQSGAVADLIPCDGHGLLDEPVNV